MATNKAMKPIIVNKLNEENVVTKSRPLMLMKEVPFELGELKVLDTYLSRINPKEPTATTVRFSKEEYEDLMGIERMRPERLNKYVTSMQGKTIRVPDNSVKSGWRNYNLFDESAFEKDENEQWWIDLCCTTKAKKLFFNVESVGYIRYQLKNVLPLKSKYSVLMYIYLLDNRFRKAWTVSVEKLRDDIFKCNDKLYKDFRYFNQRIIKKSIEEINKVTDLTFRYETVKSGRNVTHIKFYLVKDETAELKALPEPELPNILTDEEMEKEEKLMVFREILPGHFTDEQIITLRDLVLDKIEYDPFHPLPPELRAANVIKHKVNLMNASRKPVRKEGQFNWLRLALIENW